MSMSHYVFSNRRLNSIAEWQAAIDAEQLGVVLDATRPFDKVQGFLPARFEDRSTGFECHHGDGAVVTEMLAEIAEQGFDVGGTWLYMLSFTYGGDPHECRAAFLAGGAYAKATGGVLFEDQDGETFPTDTVIEKVRNIAALEHWAAFY